MAKRQLLIDSFSFKLNHLTEQEGGGDPYVFKGKFAQADLPTANRRIYPRGLWEREIKKLSKKIAEGKVYGELDHPDDGKTKLQRTAVLLTNLIIDGQGQILGEMRILNTSMGKELKAIADGGGAIGVSSRGYGSVRLNEDGYNVVQEDFTLMTFDPVADPAEESAYLETENVMVKNMKKEGMDDVPLETPFVAQKNEDEKPEMKADDEPKEGDAAMKNEDDEEEQKKDDEETEPKKMDEAIQVALENQKKTFETQLLVVMKEAKEKIRSEVLSEMLSDPSIAGARDAMEKVRAIMRPYVLPEDTETAIAAKDKEINNLKEQLKASNARINEISSKLNAMTEAAKEMGYNLYLERNLSGLPKSHVKRLMASLGDFSKIASLDELKKRVAPALKESREIVENKDQKIRTLTESLNKQTEENELLRSELDEALHIGLENASRLYLERKIIGNPYAHEIRERFETIENKTKSAVDKLVQESRNLRRNESSDFTRIRNRLTQSMKNRITVDNLVEQEIKSTKPEVVAEQFEAIPGHKFSMAEINKLAGVR